MWIAWGKYRIKFSYPRYRDLGFVDNYILVIFYKPMRFILVHELVHVFLPVDMYWDGLYFYLELVSTDLLGVGWQGRFSSLMFTPIIWHSWNLPIWLFCFKRYSKPCIFSCARLLSVSDLNIHLRDPIHYLGSFDLLIYPMFFDGSSKVVGGFF